MTKSLRLRKTMSKTTMFCESAERSVVLRKLKLPLAKATENSAPKARKKKIGDDKDKYNKYRVIRNFYMNYSYYKLNMTKKCIILLL